MEDLATSEISVFQLKQWLKSKIIINGNKHSKFDKKLFLHYVEQEYNDIITNNQVPYADRYFRLSKKILEEYDY